MRLLSIGLWHHFAYMVISMALLGFGASGSFLFLTYDRMKPYLNGWLICLVAAASISFPLAFSLSQRIGLDPLQLIWQHSQWIYLLVAYLVMSIPFLLAGSIIGIILTSTAERADRMYAVDLLGAGCGALFVVPALYMGPPWKLLPLLSGLLLLSSIGCCFKLRRPGIGLGALIISGLILSISYISLPPIPAIHDTKALPMTMALPDAKLEARQDSPLGMIHVVSSSQIRHVPGLSLNYGMDVLDQEVIIPEQKAIFIDADGLSPITSFAGDLDSLKHLDYTSMALAYHVRDLNSALIVGAGGGMDILLGILYGVSEITALEANQQIADLMQGPFATFSGHLYDRPEVSLEVREARQFMHSSQEQYDLIQLSLIDSFVNSAGGLRSATEDYLYTVEAFTDYLAHLTDSGLIAITRWLKLPPRDSLRTLSTALAALEEMNISNNPEEHVLLIRTWKTFTILVSKSPITYEEIHKAKAFCASRGFDLAYYAGMKQEEANQYDIQNFPYYYRGAKALAGPASEKYIRDYLFDISAITDDRPFFSHFFRWQKAIILFQHLRREWLPMVEMGYIFILATLAQAILASGLLILTPLFVLRWMQRRSSRIQSPLTLSYTMGPFIYFACIGFGFMFLEMAYIPRYVLLLSHPVYAAAVVLATILISTGLGSLSVRRFQAMTPWFLWIPVLVISCWVLGHVILGENLFDWALGLSLWGRFSMAVLLVFIPSFFLGWLFPSGLHVMAKRTPDLIPWAWGINGCASVIGAVLGKFLAVNMGFNFVMLIACFFYVMAVSVFYTLFRTQAKSKHRALSFR